MAILQVRDMDDRLYDRLKFAAKRDNRSISQQVITILQDYFTSAPVKKKCYRGIFKTCRLMGRFKKRRRNYR